VVKSLCAPAHPLGEDAVNQVSVRQLNEATAEVEVSVLNSLIRYAKVDQQGVLQVNRDGSIGFALSGDGYPSVELIQYRSGDNGAVVADRRQGSSLRTLPPLPNRDYSLNIGRPYSSASTWWEALSQWSG